MNKKIKKLFATLIATTTILGSTLTASADYCQSFFTFINGKDIGYHINEKSSMKINISDLPVSYYKGMQETIAYAITNTSKNQRTVGNKVMYINNDEKNPDFDKKLQSLRIGFYLDTCNYPLFAQMINEDKDIVVSIGDKSMIYYLASIEDTYFTKTYAYGNDLRYNVEVRVKVDDFHMIVGNNMKLGEYEYGEFTDISYYGATSVYDDDSTYLTVKFTYVDPVELKKGLKLSWYGETIGTIKLK